MKYILSLFLFVNGFFANAQKTKLDNNKKYELWYDAPAPNHGPDYSIIKAGGTPFDADWENWSLPIGNGYLGASIFGRTDTERIQLTENSLSNKGLYNIGSLTSFAELFIDFNHKNPINYRRSLSLDKAVSVVNYSNDGVQYTRVYFASYPDKVLVIKLKSSKAGKLSFTVRPQIPYLRNSDTTLLKDDGRTGTVNATGNMICLNGNMQYYNINYEGLFKVINFGGQLQTENDVNADHGKISLKNADSALIIVALGTNYQLKSSVFTEPIPSKKLNGFVHPHERLMQIIAAASEKSSTQLFQNHLKDYQQYFSRVSLDLGGVESTIPTDQLLANYKKGKIDQYLEELYFQYGRYLLIASSRKGTLPANLQGIWSQYNVSPWTSGYWHNVNVQMNYWPAFNTNLAEMFTAYADYNVAFRDLGFKNADTYVKKANPTAFDTLKGNNGWAVGTGASPYSIHGPGGHSGPGTGGFTTKLFWDNYAFTKDQAYLKKINYPTMLGMAKFLTKVVKPYNGLLLASPSSSPEQKVNNQNYETIGCAFDQEMIYESEMDVLKAAKLLDDTDPIIATIKNQINLLDPIQVGLSGQIKEYREEKKYGDIGEYNHRHISQLVALYPGTLINSKTPAWLDAAKVTLNERGDVSKGWSMAHRLNAWARAKDGNRAYKLYQTLLQQGTFDNLWDSHPPFQIDGNFGGTAGVAEMLLQSHEDCIEPLAAMPANWPNGSYKGLVARGNFVVSATWKNNQAISFNILSNVGGDCVVKYPGISNAIVTDKKAVKIVFKIVADNEIKFSSTKGSVYFINKIPAVEKPNSPQHYQAKIIKNSGVDLAWDTTGNTNTYNIYIAKESAPIYTQIAKKVFDNKYFIKFDNKEKLERCTIKITAVTKKGIESDGAIAYLSFE